MTEARYIVLEGIDGSGKSSLATRLANEIRTTGVAVLELEEPTDGPIGREIRKMLGEGVELSAEEWQDWFERDRAENMERHVRPSLNHGTWVVQDRSFYSTAAYQGAQGLDVAAILRRNRNLAIEPDLVLILDLPPQAAMQRIQQNRGLSAQTFEKTEYLAQVRMIYQSFIGRQFAHINADQPADEVFRQTLELVTKRFGLGQR